MQQATKTEPPIHVVVVNYRGGAYNGACLASLAAQNVPLCLHLVDNASGDGSGPAAAAFCAKLGLECRYLALPHNTLFAAGCNHGMESALESMRSDGAQYIFLLNNDTVMEPGCLAALAYFLQQHPRAGVVQALLLRLNNPLLVASAGCAISRMGGAWDIAGGEVAALQGQQARQVPGACAAASLWRATALRHVGLFDTSFGMYFEDVDISLRARKAGWNVWLLPGARVLHRVGGMLAPAFCTRFCQGNAARILGKHWPGTWLLQDSLWWLAATLLALAASVRMGKKAMAQALFQGLLTGMKVLPLALFARIIRHKPENQKLKPWIWRQYRVPPRPLP